MAAKKNYWLVKQEPVSYPFSQLVKDKTTFWEGVRNYQARNNLQAMRRGDLVLYYHSNEGKEVVGVARVTREAYGDPTTEDERWLVVDLKPLRAFERSVLLAEIKSEPALKNLPLVRQSRLSVMPVERPHFEHILRMGKTRLPRR